MNNYYEKSTLIYGKYIQKRHFPYSQISIVSRSGRVYIVSNEFKPSI